MQLQPMVRRFAPLAISLVSIGLYVSSLFLPALILERGTLRGTHVLAFGWYGLLMMNLAWFANAGYAYALSQMLCMRYRCARWAIIVAIVLSTQSWMADSWWFDEGRGTPITSLGSGYYVWTLSLIALLLASHIAAKLDPSLPSPKPATPLSTRWKGPS